MSTANTGIYKITNIINNEFYIGSTSRSFHERWYRHKYKLTNNKHDNIHLQRAYNKYGEENFIFETIEIVEPNKCIEREQYYIDTLKPYYNINKKANSRLGIKVSNETKLKISKGRTGIRCNFGNTFKLGYKTPEETKEKQSKGNLGKIVSKETKLKQSLSRLGKSPSNKGIFNKYCKRGHLKYDGEEYNFIVKNKIKRRCKMCRRKIRNNDK